MNVRSGNFIYFDNATDQIGPQHVMASGSLPSGFPATEIEGEFFWDGGLVSNTPLQWVLDYSPRQDTLVFQLDLWSARGELPRDMIEVELRQKDIRFSSRTRAATDQFKKLQMARRTAAKLLKTLPKDLLQSPEAEKLAELPTIKSIILYSLSTAPRIMKVTPKITSFPAARWSNTGRPATTMRFSRFAIRRCCNAQTEWMGSLPSISPNKIAERPDNLFQYISESSRELKWQTLW